MAGDDRVPRNGTASEERLRRRLRVASFAVIASLLILTVTADTLGRLFVDPDFHASDVVVVTLIGAVVGYATLEALAHIQPKKEGRE